ncbi:methylmalonyl Co-A mutase-associated GTPase MeaB [Lewinella sp. W8]|uniref:methylmalonyl Co-A mutase-associated GTPase MeaB n=1 Tax=Lewinella sp. W8 TaxID=2528208 RepID=UPI0010681DCE|nr:methylmalonyl Co-A mutase-associated GTPase MeaB [Lewinella sp. W8]MTB52713.1 methylmalonyl Co-A mutase-associated GTPase MeaB [Lewinella sp. W8]
MPEQKTSAAGGINRNLRYRSHQRPASADSLFAELTGPDNRRALGQAITLLESTRPEDRTMADELIALAEEATRDFPSVRLGVSGTPGVGKSTFIEAFGLEVLRAGHRLAVLAVDPSSSLSGGSILGDKTRMEELTRQPEAFIRPSPNGGHLGGVGAASRAAVLLCEAAGYDFIIVETVGVGQAEWQVHSMTDVFLLLAQPAAGDDLQGIKRGILELADHIIVNKVDSLPDAAKQTAAQIRQGLHLAPPRSDGWAVAIATASALTGAGIPEALDRVTKYATDRRKDGRLTDRRRAQRLQWLRERCEQDLLLELRHFLREMERTSDGLQHLLDQQTTLSSAADVILAEFLKRQNQTRQ